ncbi:MAG: hypothetical protein EPN73_05375 [Paraburkholderia sp.]|nr:MAG: hypothetical protein EPN73_05375 [Paraburkholderia sp.]
MRLAAIALGRSEATCGLGASLFFTGYLLFEVPGNVMLHRTSFAWRERDGMLTHPRRHASGGFPSPRPATS